MRSFLKHCLYECKVVWHFEKQSVSYEVKHTIITIWQSYVMYLPKRYENIMPTRRCVLGCS